MKAYSTWDRVFWVRFDLGVIEIKEYSTWIRVDLLTMDMKVYSAWVRAF